MKWRGISRRLGEALPCEILHLKVGLGLGFCLMPVGSLWSQRSVCSLAWVTVSAQERAFFPLLSVLPCGGHPVCTVQDFLFPFTGLIPKAGVNQACWDLLSPCSPGVCYPQGTGAVLLCSMQAVFWRDLTLIRFWGASLRNKRT